MTSSTSLAFSSSSGSYTGWDRLGEVISMEKGPVYALAEHLGLDEIQAVRQTNKKWHAFFANGGPVNIRKCFYRNMLFSQLLPGAKEEQLPRNLITYNHKTKELEWESSYKAISPMVYGRLFYKSIGVRVLSPGVPIPPGLLEKKYLPTHSIEVPTNSALSLTKNGQLTEDPESYAPKGHRYYRPLEGIKTLEFPNTQYNRDFLEKKFFLRISYPMLSPLEQGSPLVEFLTRLELDVPVGSRLWSVDGILTESRPKRMLASNGTGRVQFLDTPSNWLLLAQPVLTDPTKEFGPVNLYTGTAKYLKGTARAVEIKDLWEELDPEYKNPTESGWKAPFPKLLGLGRPYAEGEEEARQRGLEPLTFQLDNIHRVFAQIRGNPDLYPKQFSRTATKVNASWETAYQIGTHVYPPALGDPARVLLSLNIGNYHIGVASAWSSCFS